MPDAPDAPDAAEMDDFGSPDAIITTTVDVRDYVERKRAAMAARTRARSRPTRSSWRLPPDAFRDAFGTEWFIRRDAPDIRETWIFDDL